MVKNILLLFLSDVKVFKGVASVAHYKEIGDTRTTNESAVRYLSKIKGAPPNKIFYFASQKVQSTIKDFTEDGKTFTHVDYFANRIVNDVDGNIEEVMQACEFNENADIQQTMQVVIKMASLIQEYAGTLPQDTEVKLHVDMTGGMRHASLMMLVITRLIQYSGVKIGYILYSNFDREREEQFVEEANEIYNLFDLIAGAEEFVRFGSVDAIHSYFEKRNIPAVLQNLLNAMKKFADVIKISRRMEFQKALEGLQAAYTKFNEETENFSTVTDIPSLNYNLMQQLKVRIAKEYATLLEHSADDYIAIIDWCLEHGYIQQALVLYTESFPYMLVTKDELVAVNPRFRNELDRHVAKDSMKREKEYLLLNDFAPRNYDDTPIFNVYDDFIVRLSRAIQLIRQGKFNINVFKKENSLAYWVNVFGIIKSDYEDYLNLLSELQTLQANRNNLDLVADINAVAENFPTLYSFWNLIPENIFQRPANKRTTKILTILEQTPKEAFRKKSNKTLTIHHMIINDIFQLNIDEEIFLKIIDRYFIIKSERNDSVHASQLPKELLSSADSEISYATLLKKYMQQGLQEYSNAEKFVAKKRH